MYSIMTQFAQQNAMTHSIKNLLKVDKNTTYKVTTIKSFHIASVRFNRAQKLNNAAESQIEWNI